MGSSAKGLIAVYLEPTAAVGRQLLLGPSTVAATMSLTTQPNAHEQRRTDVYAHRGNRGQRRRERSPLPGRKLMEVQLLQRHPLPSQQQTVTQPSSEYGTSATFCTVNSSGVTTSGLTGGTITIYGIYAATKLVPANFNTNEKFDTLSSNDHRGIRFKHIRVQQLNKHTSLDKFGSDLYPDTSLFWAYCSCQASPTTTLIASVWLNS
jgi:hypothetical protein